QLTAVHPYCFDEALIERIKNKPSPGADEVCDYKPSLCMSNEAAFEFLCTWLGAMADRNTVKNMLVWLSEGPSPCCCEKCTGKEQFVLETSMLLRVFDWIRERRPDMNFEILLTQGSYPLNDKICEMVPEYVRVVYYDGVRTYVSDRNPIIYDMLTMYVKRGQRLGVYPQISHSWRECFPWSGLDFIRFRCQEFFEKGLNKVIAFTQPDNFHNRNNVIAMAEWLWNTKGRNESEFARALALKKGYDPDHYAHWNRLNMSQAWDLAASRFMLSSIFCYPVIHKDNVLIADHRTELAGFTAIEKIEEKIAQSEKAVEFAKQVGFEEERLESLCMLHTLKCSRAF
ncbi:MAG: hypothetical protein K8F30_01700, partial [Taibaiella sp.]|nr:hypothetical protein [Taibaiella sp.]